MAKITLDEIRQLLRVVPDFPTKGIQFCDIFPLFQRPDVIEAIIDRLVDHVRTQVKTPVDVVVGLDARGFLFGPMLAIRLGAAFAPVRKQGKLPGQTTQARYSKEYGEDVFEMQSDAVQPGQCVVIIDDLIATGGSAKAAEDLVKQQGGIVATYLFLIELPELGGSKVLNSPVFSLLEF
ncbi:adenine phosphoribosyltransferase [Dispira parvispora]|uniref:adenine phosphoribosyltransferase n=1 Tax=Dispira parvispora TaxID=1520584 RepID=A0A9W8E091_9FUNG|nr:adenine phosphoribosyltransferase [Dispira parvispora]